MTLDADLIEQARRLLRESRACVAFTGAGISVPSGVPDFRSAGTGLWERFDPMQVASLSVFRRDPQKFWNWKRPLLIQMWEARPNPAHAALAALENAGKLAAVVTQNIDRLHQRAGSRTVWELHGNIDTMICPVCRARYSTRGFEAEIRATPDIPRCPEDGAALKIDIVLYEEMLPPRVWQAAENACGAADLILVVGSSLEVWPANSLPEHGLRRGARLILFNLSSTPLDAQAAVRLPFDVAEALPAVVEGIV